MGSNSQSRAREENEAPQARSTRICKCALRTTTASQSDAAEEGSGSLSPPRIAHSSVEIVLPRSL